MSKTENRRYFLDVMAHVMNRRTRRGPWIFGLWLFLIVGFVTAYGIVATPSREGRAIPSLGVARDASASSLDPAWWVGLWALLVVGFLGIGLGLGIRRRRRSVAAYLEGLQSPDASALLSSVEKSLQANRIIPDWDAQAAHSKALVLLVYGDEDGAKRELSAVCWKQKAPLVQAMGASTEALRCLLCSHQYGEGLQWARMAQAQASVGRWPGASRSNAFYRMVVNLGEVLTGTATDATIAALAQERHETKYPLARALCLFGLLNAFRRNGDSRKAADMQRELSELAPHCRPLHAGAPALEAGRAPASEVSVASLPLVLPSSASPEKDPVSGAAGRFFIRKLLHGAALILLILLFFLLYQLAHRVA